MKIQFIGATHEVTGSCTLLEVCDKKYLVDCGMEQGIDVFENVPIPVPANTIEAVFLTHAHIDHSGMLPKLYKDGFRGSIYATTTTCDLCNIMLRDSAHIQESEAEWQNRKAQRAGDELVVPVYTTADAIGAISRFRPCEYGQVIQAEEGIIVRFSDIGHLLGSACIELWLTEDGVTKKIVFSGDVGNINQPQMVFVNHGDDAACVIFQKLLTQMGYYAEAPYSGAEYDLMTGRMTVFADSKPIRREEMTKGSARARAVYGELLAAAEALLAFVKTCKAALIRTTQSLPLRSVI